MRTSIYTSIQTDRQDRTGPDRTGQDRTRQDKTRQIRQTRQTDRQTDRPDRQAGRTRQDKTRPDQARPDQTRQTDRQTDMHTIEYLPDIYCKIWDNSSFQSFIELPSAVSKSPHCWNDNPGMVTVYSIIG